MFKQLILLIIIAFYSAVGSLKINVPILDLSDKKVEHSRCV
jgi:hypothetical protein